MSVKQKQEPREEQEEAEIILDADRQKQMLDALEGVNEEVRDTGHDEVGYTSPHGIKHGHKRDKGEGKHDVRHRWNVTDDFVSLFFISDPADHAAVHELSLLEDVARNSDVQVFEDTHNNDDRRWESINSFAESGKAPVPTSVKRELEATVDERSTP